jgi:hypothetical protein
MKNLTASIPHRLTRDEARCRIQAEVAKLRQQHGALLHDVREKSIQGFLVVGDHAVDIEVALPWLLAMLAGPVKQRVEREARLLLGGPAPA